MRALIRRRVKKGSWALLDRGLVAGSNFILTILLARWLSASEYGAFAMALAGYALLSMFHTALFVDPLLVFGAGTYRRRFSKYFGTLLVGHATFALASGAGLLLIGWVLRLFDLPQLSAVSLTLAFAAPFMLLRSVVRHACYARGQPGLAAFGGVVYMTVLLAGLWGIYVSGAASFTLAFWAMAAAGVMSAVSLMVPVRPLMPHWREKPWMTKVVLDHWRYGRWLMGASLLQWIPGNILYFALPALIGLEANAAFRALVNLNSPFGHLAGALTALLLPALVRARDRKPVEFRRLMHFGLIGFALAGAGYWAFLALLHQPLIDWMYDGNYNEYSELLVILAFTNVVGGVAAVLGAVSQALERSRWWFWSSVASAAVMLTLGLAIIWQYGLTGAVVSYPIATAATALTLTWFIGTRRSSDESAL